MRPADAIATVETGAQPVPLFLSCALASSVPYFLFSLFFARADLRAPWSDAPSFDAPLSVYFVVCGIAAATFITRGYLTLLTADVSGAAIEDTRRRLNRLLRSLPWLVAATVTGAILLAVLLHGGLQDVPPILTWAPVDLLAAVVGLLLLAGFMLLPLLLLTQRFFGSAFGHLLGDEPLASLSLRTMPGFHTVAMVGLTMLLGDHMSATGPSEGMRILALSILPYALLVMLSGSGYVRSALRGVERFSGLAADTDLLYAAEIPPDSLDAFGVAQRRGAELLRRLVESESRLRTFADAASDFYFETDSTLHVSWMSDRVEAVTGLPANYFVGRSLSGLAAELGFALDNEQLDLLWENEPFRDFVVDVSGAEGRQRRLRVSAVPQYDHHGLFTGYRGVGTDVTAIAAAEERLRERDAQLAQAQKMEAVGQLTGGVAHDFNNLLLVVSGNLELALQESRETQRSELLGSALDATHRGAGLVRQLLAFSRRQVLRPEALELGERVDGLRTLLRASLSERIELNVAFDHDLHRAMVDVSQFESALLNLAINARDAMPRGGRLSVTAANRVLPAPLDGLPPGDYVEVRVEDSGEGMTQQVLARVFEPFFSTKEVGRGTGLGLSMVYGFAKQSKGSVDIRSARGVGTTVVLLLPAASREAGTSEEAKTAGLRGRDARGERVLMVEDEPNVRLALSQCLEAAGYAVVSAGDADEALRMISAGLQFDLVLSDIVLPGTRSGVDMVEQLRRVDPELPCLLMSGYSDDHLEGAGPEIRDVELLQKPFATRDLLSRIGHLLAVREANADARLAAIGVAAGTPA